MIRYLIKATNEEFVYTIDDVEDLHKKLLAETSEEGNTLASFGWTEKAVKEQGEVVDINYIVKYSIIFNDRKNPECALKDISYDMYPPTALVEGE